jgi:uncharacterized protein YggE
MSLASSLVPKQQNTEISQRNPEVATAEKSRSRTVHKSVPVSGTGAKYTDPDFMQLKVYVRRKTKTAAARKWEDNGGRELSELVETLLAQFVSS